MGSGDGDTGLEEAKDWVKWLTRSEGIVQCGRYYGGPF